MSYNPSRPYALEYFSPRVETGIHGWPEGILSSYVQLTERMAESGPNLGMPYTRPFGDGLFEIRAHGPEGAGRAFFCTLIARRIVIPHGFIKKTQETPHHEIQIARKRQRQIQQDKSRR